ncbi:MAG: hypothetical protein ABW352_16130 [Polyangiales bacterium]
MLKSAATLRALPLLLGLSMAACGEDSKPSDDTDDTGEERDAGRRPDASRDAGRPDTGSGPTVPEASIDNDASSGNEKLDALKGRYVMRWDVVGTATSTSPLSGGPLAIRSRLSTLVIAELSVDGDKLVSTERICTQVAQQKCKDGCTSATTTVDTRTIGILKTKNQKREFTLDGDTLTGEYSIAQLGYDDEDLDTPAPTSNTDERVWNIDSSTPAREGFLTKVSVTLTGVPLPIACNAFGTQKFVSKFTATVGDEGALTFSGDNNLDLEPSEAPALGSDVQACDDQASMAKTPIEKSTARMARYGDDLSDEAFWACPAESVFNSELPPTEPNLDG